MISDTCLSAFWCRVLTLQYAAMVMGGFSRGLGVPVRLQSLCRSVISVHTMKNTGIFGGRFREPYLSPWEMTARMSDSCQTSMPWSVITS